MSGSAGDDCQGVVGVGVSSVESGVPPDQELFVCFEDSCDDAIPGCPARG